MTDLQMNFLILDVKKSFSRKARRRREIFGNLSYKIIDFIKKIDENDVQIPKNFLGAFGAEMTPIRGGVDIKIRWILK